jgi:hypothetical protein
VENGAEETSSCSDRFYLVHLKFIFKGILKARFVLVQH